MLKVSVGRSNAEMYSIKKRLSDVVVVVKKKKDEDQASGRYDYMLPSNSRSPFNTYCNWGESTHFGMHFWATIFEKNILR